MLRLTRFAPVQRAAVPESPVTLPNAGAARRSTRVEITLSAATDDRLLAQLPAVLLHESYFIVYGIEPWTTAQVGRGGRKAHAWLVPIAPRLLSHRQDVSWSETAWISKDLARSLAISNGDRVPVRLSVVADRHRVQPARIDNYIPSEHVVVSRHARRELGRMVYVSSGYRVAVVKASRRRARDQRPRTVRMNFHMRRLLGVAPDPATDTQQVQLSPYRRVKVPMSFWAWLRRVPGWCFRELPMLFELVGRPLLRAPAVTLASEESLTADDPHGVARVPTYAAELLGTTAGDSVYVYWGKARARVRCQILSDKQEIQIPIQRIVDWLPSRRPPLADRNSIILLPAKIRATLGVPRNGVVVVRRSVVSVVRRRVIALSLPVVAVTVSVSKLGLRPWLAISLLALTVVLTLAGDRIPPRPWRH